MTNTRYIILLLLLFFFIYICSVVCIQYIYIYIYYSIIYNNDNHINKIICTCIQYGKRFYSSLRLSRLKTYAYMYIFTIIIHIYTPYTIHHESTMYTRQKMLTWVVIRSRSTNKRAYASTPTYYTRIVV